MPDELTALRGQPLFAGLGDDVLRQVLDVAAVLEVPPGEVLTRASEQGHDIFVIIEGSVAVDDPGNDPIELGPGEFVGELALLVPDAVRSAWVRARTDLRCLAISGDDFQALLEAEPRIALNMLPVVARRLWRSRRSV
jgi:CRP/FNR family cyclic AMP-dependent transcriptional regulator